MTDSTPRRTALPNGINVAYQSKAELRQFYDDIFVRQVYTSHGITLAEGACVFDVGANIGLFTIFVDRLVRHARIFAFEPAPPLFELLSSNTEWCAGEILLYNCGIAAGPGTAELTFYPHSPGLSSFYPDAEQERAALRTLIHNELEGGRSGVADLLRYEEELLDQRLRAESWRCPLITLSAVIHEHGVDRIDLLKVDVEKSEADVLAGLEEEDWPKLRQAVVEVHDLGSRRREMGELFAAHGFDVHWEQEDLYHGSDRYNLYARRPS